MPPKKVAAKVPARTQPVKPAARAPARGVVAKKTTTTGAKKTATPAKGKGKEAAAPKPFVKKWGPEDDAAKVIQTNVRGLIARRKLEQKKREKAEYEAKMDRLEKEAFAMVVKMQQEEYEKQLEKEEAERRRKREHQKRIKRMLEAAFDGDDEGLLAILQEISEIDTKDGITHDEIGRALRAKNQFKMVECEDANKNTPLSEAAAGGHVSTIKLLLQKGADPNSRGAFLRTPVYRAAFAGHLEATQVLLEHGSNPKLYAEDGTGPEQVASLPAIVELIEGWDMKETERLLKKLETEKERRLLEDQKRREAEAGKIEKRIEEAEREKDRTQKQMNRAYCELEKRITEHDTAIANGFDRPDITLQAIHEAEADLEIQKIECDKARNNLYKLKLELREKQNEGTDAEGADEQLPGVKIVIRELDEVLMRDVGNKIKDSGKWPLIIDQGAQAALFLRYRDTNYLNALSPKDMEPESIRRAVLGCLRFGKFLVIDMMEVDMFDTVTDRFDMVKKNLMSQIMDKTILQEENYLPLIKAGDSDEYHKNKFNDLRLSAFMLVIITKNPFPPDKLLDATYPIRITVNVD